MLFPGNSRWNPYLSSADRSSSEMTVRRNRFASVPPGYFASTKGHSALRKWSYAPTSRASVYAEDIYYPEAYIRPRGYYDTAREENEIRRDVNSELIYTSNLLDDTYDVAARSRNRDQCLLRDATKALVDTETYASPRSSVTSRRIRATTVAPRATSVVSRAVSCPPTSFRRSNQAALVGNKVDVTLPHRRKPRSAYAANRMRELKRDEREYEVEAVPLQHTTSLKASSVTQQYPSLQASADYKPMSDVRRRVRRVICKNRGNPRYFKTD